MPLLSSSFLLPPLTPRSASPSPQPISTTCSPSPPAAAALPSLPPTAYHPSRTSPTAWQPPLLPVRCSSPALPPLHQLLPFHPPSLAHPTRTSSPSHSLTSLPPPPPVVPPLPSHTLSTSPPPFRSLSDRCPSLASLCRPQPPHLLQTSPLSSPVSSPPSPPVPPCGPNLRSQAAPANDLQRAVRVLLQLRISPSPMGPLRRRPTTPAAPTCRPRRGRRLAVRRGGDTGWRRDRWRSFLTRASDSPAGLQLRAAEIGAPNGFDPRRKIGDRWVGYGVLALQPRRRLDRRRSEASPPAPLLPHQIFLYESFDSVLFEAAQPLFGFTERSLTWPVRVDVALQTASALEYLHFALKPPVVHRDITSSNIFVERDMRIKVGDFGLSRLLSLPDPNCSSGSSTEYVCCTGPQGTPGYLDPEYHRSFRLTEKSDVYSFGVVLLELVTGMKAVDLRRDKREVSLAEFVVSKIQVGALHEVVDPILVRGGNVMESIEAVAELAFRCVAGEKDDRPNAREVVEELKRIRGLI
ncbi:uncharacterized protein A4U43_C03F15920 [Asparagus officinalis]|uniref:Protein kinase domain-containing protein n=1 Tax=Asparagus officinalis TaxID=4686 RepID=A0A5P1FFL7_ASPOF|nr:uncharacterized protein A4U43_C03F15920 [Asparagus officinalis]